MSDDKKYEVQRFLSDPGGSMNFGCDPDNFPEFITIARKIASKKTCAVKNWIWIDLDVTDEQRKMIKDYGTEPSIIYAHSCIEDSAGRFRVGDWVRTTPLINFHDPCIFETANTLYLLCGPGVRKRAKPELVARIDQLHLSEYFNSLKEGLSWWESRKS